MKKLLFIGLLFLSMGFVSAIINETGISTFNEINYTTDSNMILVVDGDSITALAQNYGFHLRNITGDFGKARFMNIAIPGFRVDQIRDKYQSNITGYKPLVVSDKGYYMVYAGINDMMQDQTASSTYDELKQVWAQARNDGFIVVAFTLTSSSLITGNRVTQLNELNNLIISDPSLYDYLVRPEFLLNNFNDPLLFGDPIHWSSEGHRQVAKMIYNQIYARPFQTTASPQSTCTGLNCQDLILNPAGKKVYVGKRNTLLSSIFNIFENSSNDADFSGITIEQAGRGDAKVGFLLTGLQVYSIGIDNSDNDKFKLSSGTNLSNNLIFEASYPGRAVFSIGGGAGPANLNLFSNDAFTNSLTGLFIEQAGTGDARLQFLISGVRRWNVGVDNSDGDKFKISPSNNAELDTETALEIDTSSNVRLPSGSLTINKLNGTYSGGAGYVCVYNNGTLFVADRGGCP